MTSIDNEVQLEFWSSVNDVLADNGRIDILSSDIAGSADGAELLDNIADMTDSDVAGSTDTTGDVDADGDWNLERGDIDLTDVYFDSAQLANYDNVFSVNPDEARTEVAFINSTAMDSDPIITELEAVGLTLLNFPMITDLMI